jgi:hypothetical protein
MEGGAINWQKRDITTNGRELSRKCSVSSTQLFVRKKPNSQSQQGTKYDAKNRGGNLG